MPSDRLALSPLDVRTPEQRVQARLGELEQQIAALRAGQPSDLIAVTSPQAFSGSANPGTLVGTSTFLAHAPTVLQMFAELVFDHPAADGVNGPSVWVQTDVNSFGVLPLIRSSWTATASAGSNVRFRSMPNPSYLEGGATGPTVGQDLYGTPVAQMVPAGPVVVKWYIVTSFPSAITVHDSYFWSGLVR